jgi:hypothetical protein
LGKAFSNIGEELSERLLGPREKHRISKVIEYAVEKLEEKHRNGVLLRGEEFFKQDMLGRSPAEELLEGTLVIGQRSYEEKKLRFLGNLYANIVSDPSIDTAKANFYLKIADSLTYRQYCLLFFFATLQNKVATIKKPDLVAEILGLESQGFISLETMMGGYGSDYPLLLTNLTVNSLTNTMSALMELHLIDVQDLNMIRSVVKSTSPQS